MRIGLLARAMNSAAGIPTFKPTGLNGLSLSTAPSSMQRTTLPISLSAEIMFKGRSRSRAWSFDLGGHLIAVDLWYHDIKQDEIEGGRLQPCKGLFAIVRAFEIGVALEPKIDVHRSGCRRCHRRQRLREFFSMG